MLAISKGICSPAREAMEAILPPQPATPDFTWLGDVVRRLRPTPLQAAVDRAVQRHPSNR